MAHKFELKIKELGLTEAGLSDKVKEMIADFKRGLQERKEWEAEVAPKLLSDIPQSEKDALQKELADDLDDLNAVDAEIEKAISAFYRGKKMAEGRMQKKAAAATPPPPVVVPEPPAPAPPPVVPEPVIEPPVVPEPITPEPPVEEKTEEELKAEEEKKGNGIGGVLAIGAALILGIFGIQYIRNR